MFSGLDQAVSPAWIKRSVQLSAASERGNLVSGSNALETSMANHRKVIAYLRGQGMTEYIIIVALIAVAAIGTYSLLGQTVRNQTAGLALEISGKAGRAAIAAAGTNADEAQTKADQQKGLSNYDEGNTQ